MTAADCWADLEAKARAATDRSAIDAANRRLGEEGPDPYNKAVSDLREAQRAFSAAANPATILKLIEAARPQDAPASDVLGLLKEARDVMRMVSDGCEDEGDRAYLGSTNHADWLRAKAEKIESYISQTGAEP